MTHFVRFAGNNEKRCIIRESLGLYGTVVTVGTYTGPCGDSPWWSLQSLTRELLLALRHTVLQHPALSTAIQDADTEDPQLVRVSRLDPGRHLYVLKPDASDCEEGENLRQLLKIVFAQPPLDPVRPQWRVYVSPLPSPQGSYRFNLAFACSHAIYDGISSSLFHTSLLKNLRNVRNLSNERGYIKHPSSGTSLPPPVDQPSELPISWSYLLAGPAMMEVLPNFVKKMLGAACEYWTGAQTRPLPPKPGCQLPTKVHVASVPPATVKNVLATCKLHNGRLTGLLTHLTAQALAQALNTRGQPATNFLVETAMDFRRNLPHGANQMINYAVGSNEILTVATPTRGPTEGLTTKDWQAIQDTTTKLGEDSTRMQDQPIALLRYLSAYRPWILKKSSSPAESSFISSNLGNFDGKAPKDLPGNQHKWEIEQMAFAQSANGTGPPFTMNFASAKGGNLVLSMSWWPGMLGVDDEDAMAAEICGDVVRRLEILARESSVKRGTWTDKVIRLPPGVVWGPRRDGGKDDGVLRTTVMVPPKKLATEGSVKRATWTDNVVRLPPGIVLGPRKDGGKNDGVVRTALVPPRKPVKAVMA